MEVAKQVRTGDDAIEARRVIPEIGLAQPGAIL
jgi:hypothetical protein